MTALHRLICPLVVLQGCATPTGQAPPGPGTAAGGTETHRPAARLAASYGGRAPARFDEVEAQVMATLASSARAVGRPVPRADRASQLAARDICRSLPASGPPSSRLVEFAMRGYGIVDPPPHMVIAYMPAGMEREVLEQLDLRFRKILGNREFQRVGIGVAAPPGDPRRRRVLAALLEHRADFDPLPRQMRRGQRIPVRFRPAASHHSVRLVVTTPGGQTEKTEPSGGPVVTGTLVCRERGVYQVEVTGEGKYGPEVLANFPVHCDRSPPATLRYGVPRPLGDDIAAIERELMSATNRMREKAKLPRLAHSPKLAEVARRHSQDMRDNRFVGHVSPTTGRPVERLQAAGVLHVVVRENVAQAYSAEEAIRELMGSPAHRENILGTDVTHLGIGVALERSGATPVMLVTQLFTKPGKPYNPATARADVLKVLGASRRAAGVPPLKVDERLSRLAADYVRTLLAGGDRKGAADAALSTALRRLGGSYSRVDGLHVKLSVIEALGRAEEITRRRYSHVGIGVGRSGDQVVIFLLLAGTR